jgi:RimJ/RimL family protein N-acetyltransferase
MNIRGEISMNTKTIMFVEATANILEEINDIYLQCRERLFENGILQWDDQYPNKDYFRGCIENGDLFVLMENRELIGHVVLNEWESEEWKIISWEESKPLVIHSLMINPLLQGKGIGTDFVKLCEEFAIVKGYKSIRLDAFSGNEKAIHLYHKLGYKKRGSVFFTSKPEGHQEYICFEKRL